MKKLNPLSPEVISRQATINIGKVYSLVGHKTRDLFILVYTNVHCFVAGTIGHVAHGKSTVVKAISGVQVRVL